MTDKLRRMPIVITTVAALAAGGASVAVAAGGDETGRDDDRTEKAITGTALGRATRLGLAQVGGGKVSATEVADEEGYYEVEVTKADGTHVDVHLNRDVSPVGREAATMARSSAGNGGGLPQGNEPVNLDPAEFTTRIDNRWWPMTPGTRWRYRGSDQDGAEEDVVVTVTHETKQVAAGVTARVVRDTVSEDGKITEDTFDFYAQDKRGNIWYLGEDTAEFENGKLSTKAGSFEAGVDGAMAGVIMPARPHDGQTYRQEYYKGEAEDRGEVLSVHEMAQTPYGRFKRALLTKDTTPLEPNGLEYKLYAPRIGPVLTLGVSGGPGSREELLKFGKASARWVDKAGSAPLGQGPT